MLKNQIDETELTPGRSCVQGLFIYSIFGNYFRNEALRKHETFPNPPEEESEGKNLRKRKQNQHRP